LYSHYALCAGRYALCGILPVGPAFLCMTANLNFSSLKAPYDPAIWVKNLNNLSTSQNFPFSHLNATNFFMDEGTIAKSRIKI
jgi:hypothetical protein